jgi:parvulin-like peptidyl-prolyl isomerase
MIKTLVFSSVFFTNLIHAKPNKEIVATVNGEQITKEEYLTSLRQSQMYIGTSLANKERVILNLINRKIGIEKAKKANLQDNPTVKEKMEDVLYHAQISKDLEGVLKKIKVTDSEVKKYYKKFPEYRTAHILLRVPVGDKPIFEDAALKQILVIHKQLLQDKNKFAELANKFTQTNAAKNGGDIGFQPKIRLAPEYFDSIKGKKMGYISSPVRTNMGFHIIKLLDMKPYEKIQKELYKKIIYDDKRNAELKKYFTGLRKNAKIKINKELLI